MLATQLEEAGYTAAVRQNGKTVYGWTKEGTFACAFYWTPKVGWRFDVAQPYIHTHADIGFALDELGRCQTASRAVEHAWERYKKERSERAWLRYQGVLAAHNFRQIEEPHD